MEGCDAEEIESSLLIELGEEIKYRRDNVASIARMLKGDIHKEFKERARKALDESAEAARTGQRKLDSFRARLEFHSFDLEAGSYGGKPPARDGEAAPGCRPPVCSMGQQAAAPPFRPGLARGGQATSSQAGSADLASLLRGWGQLKATDSGWPVFYGKYMNYPRFKKEWVAYRETFHSVMNDDLAAKNQREKCMKGNAWKMVGTWRT